MPKKHTAQKRADGWLYRGYRLDRAGNMDCKQTGDGRVMSLEGLTWVTHDSFGSMRDCKYWIDYWLRDE